MLYLCKKVRIMFQDNEYIGFVTYTQGKRNRKIPFGIGFTILQTESHCNAL